MAEQQIILTIDGNGKLTAKTHGFKGDTCIDAVAELMDQGFNVVSVKTTDEYYQQATVQHSNLVSNKRG
ncbi:DUF2997 domain-containing protein [Neptunomonas qingdaonensis]|uniref:DUF2997 domain-containing protein n=1 Tax=Neptunomonas qingdaonensis TaxID=1045558 RepID=A0A1I2TTP2_9GAMM|nr:DUF2997 domain-containing protein [Neptunomonas qingdaonensis]SFG68143.1 Protein of unknown function [Neptunomonas qingdaonensis]